MIQMLFVNIFCSFAGTIAYAVLYNIPKRFYLCCGLTGTAGWLVYVLVTSGFQASAAVGSFLGTLAVVLISRMLTVRMKCPITIFLISGIFPLVPGAGVYFTAYYLVTNQLALAAQRGLDSVKIAFGIVLGIVFIVSIPREFFQAGYWRKRKAGRRAERLEGGKSSMLQ